MTADASTPATLQPVWVFICRTCGYKKVKNPDGTAADNPLTHELVTATQAYLAEHHPHEAPFIRVVKSTCLSVCDQGIAWGLRADDRFAYTLAHVPLGPNGTPDIAATALTYLRTPPGGKMPKSDIPDTVRPHILTKLPPVR